MKQKILFFGRLEEIAGQAIAEMDPQPDLASLRQKLTELFPGLTGEVFTIAINTEIANENKSLSAGDTIALLPPFSGG